MLRKIDAIGKKHPWFWIIGWWIWAITLWILSSGNPNPDNMPRIPHLDKILHFGYFFGGGGLFCAWLKYRWRKMNKLTCLKFIASMGAIVGVIDEHHQSFVPGRTGNDVGDWCADFCGAVAGGLVMWTFLKKMKKPRKNHSE